MTDRIDFIGLGIMGRPMATNFVRAGYPVWVHARRPEAMQPLVELGAQSCLSLREVVESIDIVITMVTDTADVEQMILGNHGILSGCGCRKHRRRYEHDILGRHPCHDRTAGGTRRPSPAVKRAQSRVPCRSWWAARTMSSTTAPDRSPRHVIRPWWHKTLPRWPRR